jgi:hypothetical protein
LISEKHDYCCTKKEFEFVFSSSARFGMSAEGVISSNAEVQKVRIHFLAVSLVNLMLGFDV